MARPCSLCAAWPATTKREDRALCSRCAERLDNLPYDRALKELGVRSGAEASS